MPAWNQGRRKFSLEQLCPGQTCPVCKVQFSVVYFHKPSGRFRNYTGHASVEGRSCSDNCHSIRLAKIGREQKSHSGRFPIGEKHPDWRGGSRRDSSRGRGWESIRKRVRKKHKYCCARCGRSEKELGHTLHVHHKIPFHHFLTSREANRLSNLEPLCNRCHPEAEVAIKGFQLKLNLFGSRPGHARGSRHALAKLTETSVECMRLLRAQDPSISLEELGKRFGVTAGVAGNACSGRTYGHAPGPLTRGIIKPPPVRRGGEVNGAKLDEGDILMMRKMRANGATTLFLSKKFGLSQSRISNICVGNSWSHVGGPRTRSHFKSCRGQGVLELPASPLAP